jgi:selenocysteine-specific elongation factor
VTTIGGGRILDAVPQKHRRFRPEVLQRLQQLESGNSGAVLQAVEQLQAARMRDLEKLTGLSREILQQNLVQLCAGGELVPLGEQWLTLGLQQAWLAQLEGRCADLLLDDPLAHGVARATLKEGLPQVLALRSFDLLLEQLLVEKRLQRVNELLAPPDWRPLVSPRQAEQLEQLRTHFEQQGLQVVSLNQVIEDLKLAPSEVEPLVAYLSDNGDLVRLSSENLVAKSAYALAVARLMEHFSHSEELSLARYRDLIGGGRRLAQALLEHFDSCKYTRRQGDVRLAWNLPSAQKSNQN